MGATSVGWEMNTAVRAILAVYREHPTGGNLHTILDDYNVEDAFMRVALQRDGLTLTERHCVHALLALSEIGRRIALATAEVEMEFEEREQGW